MCSKSTSCHSGFYNILVLLLFRRVSFGQQILKTQEGKACLTMSLLSPSKINSTAAASFSCDYFLSSFPLTTSHGHTPLLK